jgi:hypothetical protein
VAGGFQINLHHIPLVPNYLQLDYLQSLDLGRVVSAKHILALAHYFGDRRHHPEPSKNLLQTDNRRPTVQNGLFGRQHAREPIWRLRHAC